MTVPAPVHNLPARSLDQVDQVDQVSHAEPIGARVLTARERQVVALIARGYSNREIAGELYLSVNSVKTYIRSAYRKIGVERRTQAVIWWLGPDQDAARAS
jgi:DNA-binding NarL/FixJ family response regulator